MLRLDLEGQAPREEPADARHWVEVYDELINTCRQIIGNDEPLPGVKMRLYEFERRREYWRRLLRE